MVPISTMIWAPHLPNHVFCAFANGEIMLKEIGNAVIKQTWQVPPLLLDNR